MTTAPNMAVRRRGFTLIELMAVIAIVAVMAAMIIPEMGGGYQEALLHSNARELMNVFNSTCSRSIAVSLAHRVRLDPHNGKYVVEKNLLEGRGDKFAPAEEMPGGKGQLDPRIAIEVHDPDEEPAGEPGGEAAPDLAASSENAPIPGQTIEFYPDGTADAKEVILQDRDGFRLALRINPVTAHVSVVELQRVMPQRGGRRASIQ